MASVTGNCCSPDYQDTVARGYAVMANMLGSTYRAYRLWDNSTPIVEENALFTLKALFSQDPKFSARRTPLFNDHFQYAALSSNVRAGDYLIEQVSQNPAIYYLAAPVALTPAVAVRCNVVVRIERPISQSTQSAADRRYGGHTGSTQLADALPVRMVVSGRGDPAKVALPDTTRQGNKTVYMPEVPGVILNLKDELVDRQSVRWTITGIDLTELGLRLQCECSTAG